MHSHPIAPNLLDRKFVTSSPNDCWVSDVTYIRVAESWTYLCVFLDLYSRKIVGWRFSHHLDERMVAAAFRSACEKRGTAPKLIHSDRGREYAGLAFRREVEKHPNCQRSMSRRANCLDNAVAESFFSTIKTELGASFDNWGEAELSIFDYIELFYNRERLHSTLNYTCPNEFEQAYHLTCSKGG